MNYKEIENAWVVQEIWQDKCYKLEEENRLLKNEIAWLKDHTKYNGITKEYYIDWTMTATEAKLRLQQAEANQNYVSKLEQENKKLKEYKSKRTRKIERENKKLKEENKKLKEEIWKFIMKS